MTQKARFEPQTILLPFLSIERAEKQDWQRNG